MNIKAPLIGIALATVAATASADETPLDTALVVGDESQAVHAEPFHNDTFDGGIIKIVDDESTVSGADKPQINAVMFECFDPNQPDKAVEELAEKFIRYANETSVEERLAEFEHLQSFANDAHAFICHDR